MSGPDLDLEKPNAIGGLDKLVTYSAISTIAVVPTFLTCIFMPWRLTDLLDHESPDGRQGMMLAPGAYFPLSLLVSLIVAALLSTPETVSTNGSFIGPGLAVTVQKAATNGDIWKIVATIMPIYGVAVFIGLLGLILKPLAGPDWSLRISLRSAFYVMGTLTSWLILTTAVIDLVRISTNNAGLASAIYQIITIPTAGAIIWMFFWFLYRNGAISRLRAGALCLGMFGLIVSVMWLIDVLIRL